MSVKRVRRDLSLEELDKRIQRLTIEKGLLWEKLISSNNSEEIMQAVSYQKKEQTITASTAGKSYLFAPDNEFYSGMGYKVPLKIAPFEFLRNMGATPVIYSIISTRINQVLDFGSFTTDENRQGWSIRKRRSRFEQEPFKLTDQDKRAIDGIADFLENGGKNAKFTLHSDFHDFLKIFPRDLLELDQGCFEIQRTRSGELLSYDCVDSSTIRLLETIDPGSNVNLQERYEELQFKDAKYLPYYCQVWREHILRNPKTHQEIIWYPWEMCFAVRNKTSNIYRNGYGFSELEALIRVVTWLLESMEYNGRFFTNGSNPRGFFTIKGSVSPQMLNDFRMAWRSMVAGWQNAHKVPIFEADKIDWVSMQNTNAEMEYTQWMEFLILVTCSVFKIDPSELGFRFRQQNQLFGEREQHERLQHSRDKGLKPLLKVIQKSIDKFIVSELNPSYEFVFTGIDIENEVIKLESDMKKLQSGVVAMQDKFKEYSGRDFNPDKDIILNPIYLQQKMQQYYGGQQMNQQVNEEEGGEETGVRNPFEELREGLEKGRSDDPIVNELIKYINFELPQTPRDEKK